MVGTEEPDVWRYLSQDQLRQYKDQVDPEAAARCLAEALNLHSYRFDAREAIKLDYAISSLEFAQKHSFGLVRTAALFSIAMDVLTAVEGGGSSKECEQVLKAALVSSVRARPVGDDPHFWPEHVQQVGAFFASTFFAHFRLYQFAFSTAQQHTEHHTQLVLETAVIQDFRGALSEDEWAEYHERLAAAAEAERVAAEQAEEARVAAIKAAEEERARAEAEEIRRELLQRKPATLDQAIEHMVAIRLEQEKAAIEAEYREREEVLLARIEQLTLKAAQGGKGGAAAGGEKKGAKAAAAAAGATAK